MEDYKSMTYYTLKNECKKKGLDSKGKREVLLERLGVKESPIQKEKPEIKAPLPTYKPKTILPATEEDLKKHLPSVSFNPPIDVSRYARWLTEERLQILENKLKPIFAGKATFDFQLDYDKATFGIEFDGRAAGKEYMTLIVEDNFILRKADQYCRRRLAVGGNGQVTSMR